MISGLTRKTATPTPFTSPIAAPVASPNSRAVAVPLPLPGGHVRRRCRDVCDGQVDASGQHHERLAAGDQPEQGRDQERRRELLPGDEGRAGLVAVDEVGDDEERDEHDDQDEGRVVGDESLQPAEPPRASSMDDRAHVRPRRWRSPPIITTTMIRTPVYTAA